MIRYLYHLFGFFQKAFRLLCIPLQTIEHIFQIVCIDFDVLVEAQTKCQIIQISPAIFLQLFSQNIHVELFSYKLATERFSDVMWAMQQILFISFDKRLAAFLLDESNRSNSLDIKMTHEQIAQNLNSAREVVSRMLNYFAKEGYVSLSRGQIHIIDKQSLSSLI